MNWIISYPRSGNTWLRYIIEELTGQPTDGLCGKPSKTDRLQRPLIHEGNNYIAKKSHNWDAKHGDKVIFILRDYKEAIIRHNYGIRDTDLKAFERYIIGNKGDYIDLLRGFDQHKGSKLLIYYEDLVKRPAGAIPKILNILGHQDKNIVHFLRTLAEHKEKALKIYPNPQSKGEIGHHIKKIENPSAWDELIKRKYSYLFTKYLERYVKD